MKNLRARLALSALMLVALLLTNRAPTQTVPPPAAPPGLEKIQHFVFIMQENRSFDHYFGTYPGAEGVPPGVCVPNPALGPCVAPYHDAGLVNQGGAHNWRDALNSIHGGLMDGFIAGSGHDNTALSKLRETVFGEFTPVANRSFLTPCV